MQYSLPPRNICCCYFARINGRKKKEKKEEIIPDADQDGCKKWIISQIIVWQISIM